MRKREKQQRQIYRDPDGIKIRIFDAYRMQHRGIQGDLFDEYFENLGVQVIKRSQPERCRDNRNIFNSNRFIVVKKENDNGDPVDFGERIQVSGVQFNLSYYGIQKWCPECDRKHGWDCPTKVRSKFLRELRKGTTGKTKIYSDSTLRHANQLALRTDVSCMSGGGIAQICNLIPYDEPREEVIINAGTNELKTDSLHEFVYTVQKTEQKLRHLSAATNVTVVLPAIVTSTPETVAKSNYLRETIVNVDSVDCIQLKDIEYDDTDHPTIPGTQSIITAINDACPEQIILQGCQDDVTVKRKYRMVQPVFKVGCRGCDSLEYTPNLCATCKDHAQNVDTSQLEMAIEKLKNEMFPAMDIEMVNVTNKKRSNENDDNECPTPNAKAPKGGN